MPQLIQIFKQFSNCLIIRSSLILLIFIKTFQFQYPFSRSSYIINFNFLIHFYLLNSFCFSIINIISFYDKIKLKGFCFRKLQHLFKCTFNLLRRTFTFIQFLFKINFYFLSMNFFSNISL